MLNQLSLLDDFESNLLLSSIEERKLFKKLTAKNSQLKDICLIVCGLTPYRLGKGKPPQTKSIVDKRIFDSDKKINDTYRRYIMGRDFNKYCWQVEKERWISYGDWLAEPRHKAPFDEEIKLIVRQTSDIIIAHLDTHKFLSLKNVHNIKVISNKINYEYLLGILNSKLINWWYQQLIPEKGRVFAEVKVVNLEKIPIKIPAMELVIFNQLTNSVNQMLESKKQLMSSTTEKDKTYWENRCASIDKQIDNLVYELYGLTDEEIKIVEGESQ